MDSLSEDKADFDNIFISYVILKNNDAYLNLEGLLSKKVLYPNYIVV